MITLIEVVISTITIAVINPIENNSNESRMILIKKSKFN